tara:strand:- start:227 stop:1114 length:888 start_codon:yes stop_codon:yes gene_type:complete
MTSPKKNIYGTTSGAIGVGSLIFSPERGTGTPYGCSNEQIFSPITTSQAGGNQYPGFEPPLGSFRENGDFGNGGVGPTVSELNPYFSNVLDDFFDGIDFGIASNNHPDGELNLQKLTSAPYNIDTVGLRGPLMLSGWGYDIADRPVPSSDGDTHDTDMQGDRTTWKSGPVNLQWDAERKVWQGGPQIVCGVVLGAIRAPTNPCRPTSFRVRLLRLQGADTNNTGRYRVAAKELSNRYSPYGSDCEEIVVSNRDPSLEEVANSGMIFCIAVRINYEWLPIWIGCPDTEGGGQCTNC